jgi:glycosyltransferase involved in cell wall biosynthesis
LRRPNTYLNYVSASQRQSCPKSRLLLRSIPNGGDIQRLDAKTRKANYILALGRICPEKGYHFALEAAGRARAEMILAGGVAPYETHQRYFRTEIQPQLNHRRLFIGPADFKRKRRS